MTARDLITMNICKMFELVFKTTIMKIIAGLKKIIEDTRESLTSELKSIQAEIKNAIAGMQT